MSRFRQVALAIAVSAAAGCLLRVSARPSPQVVLWLWERPESVSDVRDASFAVLTGAFEVSPGGVQYRARRHPVVLPPSARTTAVYRIDVTPDAVLQTATIAEQILAATPEAAAAVQIDFDARSSERAAYRELLTRLRSGLPSQTALSITALASWCLEDPWIRDLPVDEAVAMLFQMGPDGPLIKRHVNSGGEFSLPLCHSAGVAIDEPMATLPRHVRRVYLFSPQRWTAGAVAVARQSGAFR